MEKEEVSGGFLIWVCFVFFSYIAEGFGAIGSAGRSRWRRRSSQRCSHHDQISFTAGSVTAVDGRPVVLLVARCWWWKMIRTTCCCTRRSRGSSLDTVGGWRFFTGGCCCRCRVGWTHIRRSFLLQQFSIKEKREERKRLNEIFSFFHSRLG